MWHRCVDTPCNMEHTIPGRTSNQPRARLSQRMPIRRHLHLTGLAAVLPRHKGLLWWVAASEQWVADCRPVACAIDLVAMVVGRRIGSIRSGYSIRPAAYSRLRHIDGCCRWSWRGGVEEVGVSETYTTGVAHALCPVSRRPRVLPSQACARYWRMTTWYADWPNSCAPPCQCASPPRSEPECTIVRELLGHEDWREVVPRHDS